MMSDVSVFGVCLVCVCVCVVVSSRDPGIWCSFPPPGCSISDNVIIYLIKLTFRIYIRIHLSVQGSFAPYIYITKP
jgi:hypothetical protein